MRTAMTALAVVLLAGTAVPAMAAPPEGDRQERMEDHDRPHRDDRGGGQRSREAPRAREAPTAIQAPQAPQAPRAERGGERRGEFRSRADWAQRRGESGENVAQGQGGGQRVDGRRGDGQRWDGRRGEGPPGEGPRGDGRRWDGDRDGRRDGDGRWEGRRDGDGRWDGRRDGDRRWDGRREGDRRWDGRDGRRDRWDGRRGDRWEHGRYPNNYRSRYRYHWNDWRRPSGFYVRLWSFGDFLPRGWFGPEYWIADPWAYGLPLPPPGFDWVRVGEDAVLVDNYTGRVVQVVRFVFW